VLRLKVAEAATQPVHREPDALHRRRDSPYAVHCLTCCGVVVNLDSGKAGVERGHAFVLHHRRDLSRVVPKCCVSGNRDVATGLDPGHAGVERRCGRPAFLHTASEADYLLRRSPGLSKCGIMLGFKIAEAAAKFVHREPEALRCWGGSPRTIHESGSFAWRRGCAIGFDSRQAGDEPLRGQAAFLHAATQAGHLLRRSPSLAERGVVLRLKAPKAAAELSHGDPESLHRRGDSPHTLRKHRGLVIALRRQRFQAADAAAELLHREPDRLNRREDSPHALRKHCGLLAALRGLSLEQR